MVNAPQFKELYNEQMANQGNALFDFSNWNANTDWQDEIFQTGFITNNNVSITGASENIASISAWVTLTNRETSSMKNTAK